MSMKREQHHNYGNLPVKFQTLTTDVIVVDLSTLKGKGLSTVGICPVDFDVFGASEGFKDAFSQIKDEMQEAYKYPEEASELICYSTTAPEGLAEGDAQSIGILMPDNSLPSFNSNLPVAMPLSSLAITSVTSNTGKFRTGNICTTCETGFGVTYDKAGNTYKLSISGGEILLQPGKKFEVDGKKDAFTLKTGKHQIHLLLWYQPEDGTTPWKTSYYTEVTDDVRAHLNKPFTKTALIATVHISQGFIDISQPQCSPIDMRDWVSEAGIPTGSDTLYVFGFNKSSNMVKGWIPVRDC